MIACSHHIRVASHHVHVIVVHEVASDVRAREIAAREEWGLLLEVVVTTS